MQQKIRRIGVLTSGGDAPGMNAAIRSVVRTCVRNDVTPIGIHRGYSGLIRADADELDARAVNGIIARGGTVLYTARSEEFKMAEGLEKALQSIRYLGLDGLIVIGGDGTFQGAKTLSDAGIPVMGIPGTIDNDIGCTHYSIGFDTAANTAIDVIDKLADTMQSHERISVVEVMGRNAGHLAVYVGLAVGATAILIPEHPFDFEQDVLEHIREGRYRGKNHHLIVVAEGVGHTAELAARIQTETGMETRLTIIGYVQRGGSPSARDRTMATRMGHYAVEQMLAGNHGRIVCYRESHLCALPIAEALVMKKTLDAYMYRVACEVSI